MALQARRPIDLLYSASTRLTEPCHLIIQRADKDVAGVRRADMIAFFERQRQACRNPRYPIRRRDVRLRAAEKLSQDWLGSAMVSEARSERSRSVEGLRKATLVPESQDKTPQFGQ